MLETGIVAGCLMNGIFRPLVNKLVELTGIDEAILKSQITFICAMHDIGKAHPVFQGRDTETNELRLFAQCMILVKRILSFRDEIPRQTRCCEGMN